MTRFAVGEEAFIRRSLHDKMAEEALVHFIAFLRNAWANCATYLVDLRTKLYHRAKGIFKHTADSAFPASMRRANYAGFDVRKLARFDAKKVDALMQNAGLVRHRGKLESVALNARAFLAIQEEHGSFAKWLWAHVDDEPVVRRSHKPQPTTPLAEKISKELKRRGMKFVGPTIVQAYLQAVGVYDEHLPGCWKA